MPVFHARPFQQPRGNQRHQYGGQEMQEDVGDVIEVGLVPLA